MEVRFSRPKVASGKISKTKIRAVVNVKARKIENANGDVPVKVKVGAG